MKYCLITNNNITATLLATLLAIKTKALEIIIKN